MQENSWKHIPKNPGMSWKITPKNPTQEDWIGTLNPILGRGPDS